MAYECGECGEPVQLFQGKKKGTLWYKCRCGFNGNALPDTPTGKKMLESLA